jgi:hypothetical protein
MLHDVGVSMSFNGAFIDPEKDGLLAKWKTLERVNKSVVFAIASFSQIKHTLLNLCCP